MQDRTVTETARSSNNTATLGENFIGYALDRITQRIKDQKSAGLKTRIVHRLIVDPGHTVDAIFYSPDGAAMELKDTVLLDTEVLEGETVIQSDPTQLQYFVVLTGAEDRWKVRVLESALGQ